jgi:hypothetical protein
MAAETDTYALDRRALAILNLPYREPLGLPLRWQDEESGALPAAVWHYIRGGAEPRHLVLVHAYLGYWCSAPCWTLAEGAPSLLEAWAAHPPDRDGIWQIVLACLDAGCDPL